MYHLELAQNCFEQNLTAHLHPFPSMNACGGDQQQVISIQFATTKPIAAGEILYFWPSLPLLALFNVPAFALPENIVSGTCYVCTYCRLKFTQPNPLKIHVRFNCVNSKLAGTDQTGPQNNNNIASLHGKHLVQWPKNNNRTSTVISDTERDSPQVPESSSDISSTISVNGGNANETPISPTSHNHNRRLHNCQYCG